MKNIFKKSFLYVMACLLTSATFAQTTIGTYSKRVISADGKTSTWTFDVVSGSAKTVADNTDDNGILYVNGGGSNKAQTSSYFSFNKSEFYIEVPSGSAGKISMVQYSSGSDSRWFQLYVNGTAAADTKRLWSKAGDGTDGKKGPQSFDFVSSDITSKDGKTYLHFKTNNTEMKVVSFTITLTTGSYTGPVLPSSDATLKSLKYGEKEIVLVANKFDYDVELPYGTTEVPNVTAEANDTKATAVVTQASELPGTAEVNVTAEDGTTKSKYTINFSVAETVKSSDATLKSLTYGGQPVPGFAANKYSYDIELPEGTTTAPTIAAEANDEKATVALTQASSVPGTAIALVTAEDNSQLQYKVNFTAKLPDVPVPSTELTLHTPGKYEDTENGGYGTDLAISEGREFEVYYTFKGKLSGSSIATVATTPGGTYLTDASSKALDGWFDANPGSMEESGADAIDEFAAGGGNWKMKNKEYLKLRVKGYDQFTILAADNNASDANKQFHIFVNGADVTPTTHSTTPTLRRVALSATQEYVIEVQAYGGSQMKLYGWSLRVAEIPKVKYVEGDLENQEILQTQEMKPITFFSKYNSKGETKVIWEGAEATGFALTKKASTALGDTLVLSGKALCQTGEHPFRVVSLYNGEETGSIPGKITVKSQIKATSEVNVTVRQGKQMEDITFIYYALQPSDVILQWTNQTPEGITASGNNGEYVISGKPTTIGEFPYTISVVGGNSIEGLITVEDANLGPHPVLYLCRKRENASNDGIYEYLKGKGVNFDVQVALKNLRDLEEYAQYDWILISEDVDADNTEVLGVARGQANKPVLNMKSFSYSPDRLGWGEPDNGSLTEEGCYITVQREDHPILAAFNKKKGEKIKVLDKVVDKGLMPADVNLQGSICLATALTRDMDDYYGDGVQQTFLHEVPAKMRGNNKYICLPIALSSSKYLSLDGKKLLDRIVNYIQNTEPTVALPTLQINSFVLDGVVGEINQGKNTIYMEIDKTEHPDLGDLTAVEPTVTLADDVYTFLENEGKTIDFTTSMIYPVPFVVTDFINRRVYEVTVRIFTSEGLEEVYAVGDWINIFDIYGRKIATTNENIFTMSLPRGVYLIVNEQGKTAKILK